MSDALTQGGRIFKYTHKGWWLFCPVYLAALETEAPLIAPRWFWCAPLYWLAHQVQALVIGLCTMCFEEYEPQWYFMVTGELNEHP